MQKITLEIPDGMSIGKAIHSALSKSELFYAARIFDDIMDNSRVVLLETPDAELQALLSL